MQTGSKEHFKDRVDRTEDSHQVKHWVWDHPDLHSPPPFKIKMIGGFKDPLTRQLSEAVRIERAGDNILNSKSEYSRCRIPRLRIDMEGWTKPKKDEQEKANTGQDDTVRDLEETENEVRRQEAKRKEGQEGGRRKRRTKFPRMEGWGSLNLKHRQTLNRKLCRTKSKIPQSRICRETRVNAASSRTI